MSDEAMPSALAVDPLIDKGSRRGRGDGGVGVTHIDEPKALRPHGPISTTAPPSFSISRGYQ